MFGSGNDPGSTAVRNKRIGSLSIANSVDVLRQRVLLELARRQAKQNQYQIDSNRQMMETIGKRSNSDFVTEYPTNADTDNSSGIYVIEERQNDPDQSKSPVRISDRTRIWLQEDNHDHENDQEQARRVDFFHFIDNTRIHQFCLLKI